jgi:seryl-tRNA synthetase
VIDLQKYQRLKERVDELRRQQDRASGVVSTIKATLKEEFGVSTLKQAKTKLKELLKEQDEAEGEYEEKLEAFEKEFGEILNED